MTKNTFSLSGVTCGSCVAKIEDGLEKTHLRSVKVTRNPDRIEFQSEEVFSVNSLNELFKEFDLAKYTALNFQEKPTETKSTSTSQIKRLYPLALIISYLIGTVLTIAWITTDFSTATLMSHYMGGFFLIFSFFKFLNLKGFVDAFQTYDPIAKAFRPYGYFYASFELIAGVAYLVSPQSLLLNLSVLLLLSISSIGVSKAVLGEKQIQCACLGTVFNLPMTYVTIIENATMIIMAAWMIFS